MFNIKMIKTKTIDIKHCTQRPLQCVHVDGLFGNCQNQGDHNHDLDDQDDHNNDPDDDEEYQALYWASSSMSRLVSMWL